MKRDRFAIVLVLLLTTSTAAVTVGGAGADADRAKVALDVTVTDNFNNGIGDAEVTATWDGGSTSQTTISDGRALLEVPEGADVRLFVNHSAYTLNNPVVLNNASAQEVSITVFRKAKAQVSVVDDGTAIEGAEVTLVKEGDDRAAATGTTGSDGVFTSGIIEKGTYTVSVVKRGYLRNETTVTVEAGANDPTETTVAIQEGTATVTFSVRDDHFDSPRPLENATVSIEGPTTASLTTSGDGSATLGLPVNARFTVTVTKPGYESASRTLRLGESAKTVEVTINREPALTVDAVNERVVVGEKVQVTVTDEYGDRVAGATVLVDGEEVGQTDEDGVYRATIESAGEHTITVRDGDVSTEVTVEGVESGGDATPTDSDTATATATSTEPGNPLDGISQPNVLMQLGVAAIGVLLAFLLVRRLL